MTPVSDCYGYDRGNPVDRHYIEAFLAEHAAAIHGDGAEVKDDTYLRRFGHGRLRSATVIDIDPGSPRATLHADLATAGSLPGRGIRLHRAHPDPAARPRPRRSPGQLLPGVASRRHPAAHRPLP